MADMIYEKTADIIVENINRYLGEVNSRPVYTIHELLHGKKLALKSNFSWCACTCFCRTGIEKVGYTMYFA